MHKFFALLALGITALLAAPQGTEGSGHGGRGRLLLKGERRIVSRIIHRERSVSVFKGRAGKARGSCGAAGCK